ncbi:MAG TPA: hypothetical protein VLF69_02315 [Candidatus Saccharimonadales bacterium]|nr:hypothetical protein [Candidatus Saccharimonadales bacterium]
MPKIEIADDKPANTPDEEPETAPADSPDSDTETDKAVDDIQKKDSDDTLKAQDEIAEKAVVMKSSPWERCKNALVNWWNNPLKRGCAIGGLAITVIVLFSVPFTRYNIIGLVLKVPVTVQAVDSKSGAPVSGATIKLGGQTAETAANGKVTLHVHAGSKTLVAAKKYYTGSSQDELLGLSNNTFQAKLVALGRQVTVKVIDKVSGKPAVNVAVSASGAKAKTNTQGLAVLVIPSGAKTQAASLSLSGYNTASVTITAGNDLAKNTFGLTPAGKLYFLSNLSGKIDVVKTNLDGSSRQTVLIGTGNEDKYSTSLLASRDWKYLALLSKRSGDNASLYLIDTTNGDKLTTIDEGNANFTLVGWSGDRFIYQVNRNGYNNWQPNQQALKSFDPTTGHTLLLDQTQASGSNDFDYTHQSFGNVSLIGDQVVYIKNWSSYYTNTSALNGKSAELDAISADGSGHKTIKTFAPASGYQASNISVDAEGYEPGGLYLNFNDGNQDNFYDYDGGKVVADSTMTTDKFYSATYPTYLASPSNNNTFWSESRDGKNTLFVGNADGKSPKQVASLSDYNTYGWYTDNYLLVSKSSSELYIMPVGGGTPLKITDYYKPAFNYAGYGGGYGGL